MQDNSSWQVKPVWLIELQADCIVIFWTCRQMRLKFKRAFAFHKLFLRIPMFKKLFEFKTAPCQINLNLTNSLLEQKSFSCPSWDELKVCIPLIGRNPQTCLFCITTVAYCANIIPFLIEIQTYSVHALLYLFDQEPILRKRTSAVLRKIDSSNEFHTSHHSRHTS